MNTHHQIICASPTLDIFMSLKFHAVFEKGDKYYIGYCLEVPGANGQGETVEECRENLREAIKLILETRAEDARNGLPIDVIEEEIAFA